jgi:hypothetical protein
MKSPAERPPAGEAMNSADLYQKLEVDFRLSECRDEWSDYGEARFVAPQFHQRLMGLFLDDSPVMEDL